MTVGVAPPLAGTDVPGDALALVELDSIARGWRALDALVKEAPVTVLEANLVEPGHYLILFGGGVEETDRALAKALEIGADAVRERAMLPFAHPRVWDCLRGRESVGDVDCVGIVEGRAVAPTILGADAAIKEANVTLCALRLTPALGGKAYFVVTGAQTDVEAAVEAGAARLEGRLHRAEIIPNAHPEFLAHALRRAPFGAS